MCVCVGVCVCVCGCVGDGVGWRVGDGPGVAQKVLWCRAGMVVYVLQEATPDSDPNPHNT